MKRDLDVEQLADEVAHLAGESRAEAVRRALEERRARLAARAAPAPGAALRTILEQVVWPRVPPDAHTRPWSRADEDALLGSGEHGV